MATLYPKKRYRCDSRYLSLGLSIGYEVSRVHKILNFESSPWLRGFIDKNTKLRQASRTKFEKDLWKLFNNSVYGKTIENKRRRRNIRVETDSEKIVALKNSPKFNDILKIEDAEMYVLDMDKRSVRLDSPVYCGLSILDISKILPARYHYEYMEKKFKGRYESVMGDTDSMVYLIQTEDFYKEIAEDVEEWYDTSNLPDTLPLKTGVNRMVIGKLKDETEGNPIHEIVVVAPKQYSIKFGDTEPGVRNKSINKCKGITKGGLRDITFEDYKEALLPSTKPKKTDMVVITSKKHTNYTKTITKKVFDPKASVDPNKTKRYVLPNGIDTLPWGHYSIKK